MDERVVAPRSTENLRGAVGDHLVRIHVVRRAGAGLIDVYDELIAKGAAANFVARPDNRARDARVEPFERFVRFGGGALDENRRDDEICRSAQLADGEVFYGSSGLDAVIGVGGNLEFTERIALGSKLHGIRRSNYTWRYASSVFRQRALAGGEDLDRSASRRSGGDENGDGGGATGDAIGAGARDHRGEHRPRRGVRRGHMSGHGHAHFRGEDAGWRQPDRDAETAFRRRRGGDPARKAQAQFS